jgi:decaprenylphospho-beta-D-erythro-pentofuranosid-2-ulose 2-reductase
MPRPDSAPVRTALVLGGSSDLALATVRRLITEGLEQVVLAGRDPAATATRVAGAALALGDDVITIERWDALDTAAHEPLLAAALGKMGSIDLVLCAVGSLGHGAGATAGPTDVADIIAVNFAGPAAALTAAADALRRQGHGAIVVLSSVAGLRARRSNFPYGAAKAGLDAFAAGLADSLTGTGVTVHVIRPGFVHTRMTEGLTPAPFAAQPDEVADAICLALAAPKSTVRHVPRLLGPLFMAFRATPRPLWRRIAGDR